MDFKLDVSIFLKTTLNRPIKIVYGRRKKSKIYYPYNSVYVNTKLFKKLLLLDRYLPVYWSQNQHQGS